MSDTQKVWWPQNLDGPGQDVLTLILTGEQTVSDQESLELNMADKLERLMDEAEAQGQDLEAMFQEYALDLYLAAEHAETNREKALVMVEEGQSLINLISEAKTGTPPSKDLRRLQAAREQDLMSFLESLNRATFES